MPHQIQAKAPRYLTPEQLSARFGGNIKVTTLANWRNLGIGPKFTKLGGKVLYPITEVEEFEKKNTVQCTSQYGGGGS
jgi:hypothetical protein